MEGAGIVIELGSAVRDLAVGTQVILPHSFGTWREVAVIAADKLVAAPKEIEPIQAAMLKVNPITAWRMLHDFVSVAAGRLADSERGEFRGGTVRDPDRAGIGIQNGERGPARGIGG